MSRISALLLTAAVLTVATAVPASAATPTLDPIATASAYALTVNGQTEGLSITWRPTDASNPSFQADKHVVGPTALHPGWGVHLADQDVAPQFPNTFVRLGTYVSEFNRVTADRVSSIALTDSHGAFMAFSEADTRAMCALDPEQPNGHGAKTNFAVYTRNAQGQMVAAPGNGLGTALDVPGVDAGDQATPDGLQRTTTVHFKRSVQTPAGLAPWSSEFPGTYEAAYGLNLVVTQSLGDAPPVVYNFLIGGGACAA